MAVGGTLALDANPLEPAALESGVRLSQRLGVFLLSRVIKIGRSWVLGRVRQGLGLDLSGPERPVPELFD